MRHARDVWIPQGDRTESKYGLAMRALIAMASEGDEGWCHFSKYCPVFKVLAFTRPDELDQIQATSEHSDAIAKCRKSYKFLKHFWTFTRSPTQFHDTSLLTDVFKGFCNYAARVGVAGNRLENVQKKMGHGAKVA